MTSFQIEWWTPVWKRLLLVGFWAAMVMWCMIEVSTSLLAFSACMLGATWYQMFTSFGAVKLPDQR